MEEEGGARRGRPAASGGRTEEEGEARRGRPAASGGRTEEEAGTESSKEEEVTTAQREEGRRWRTGAGEDRCGGLRGDPVSDCDCEWIG